MAFIKGDNSGTNVRKMMCNDSKLEIVNMNAYIKFGENLSICSLDIERKRFFRLNQGNNSGTNMQKMACINPKIDLVNMNAYIIFGENQSISS